MDAPEDSSMFRVMYTGIKITKLNNALIYTMGVCQTDNGIDEWIGLP